MEAPNQDRDASVQTLSYAYPTTRARWTLPLSVAITLIICGTIVMVFPVVAANLGSRRIGSDPDVEVGVLLIGGLIGGAMIVFAILKSMNRTTTEPTSP
jgi:hypothetical protein